LVENLETSASLLHLFHQFAEKPNFVFYCEPGNESMVEDAYAKIHELYPDVLYVIQILPFKNAREFTLLKSLTLKYALIGQGFCIVLHCTIFSV
jgi:hypothetical protein